MPPPVARIDLTPADLDSMLDRTRPALSEEDYRTLQALVDTFRYLTALLEDHTTTIARLRQLLLGATTEKTRQVLQCVGLDSGPRRPDPDGDDGSQAPGERHDPGHGRHGAGAYAGARRTAIAHASLTAGDRCPGCAKGKLYAGAPGVLVRLVGQAPIAATVYELEKLRCNLCGEVFTAAVPDGVGAEKYDPTAASMIALLKYGRGLPFHRLDGLQASLQIPLPASTQWDIVQKTAAGMQPALDELIRQAAQGEVLHNDDTGMTVLALRPAAAGRAAAASDPRAEIMSGRAPSQQGLATPCKDPGPNADPARTGVFTSGIVATRDGHRIALFFTGHRHAGENLAAVLAHRAAALGPPLQMCDALARNLPKPLAVIVGHCLAHARRQFVKVTPNFPEACRHVLETLAEVYRHDAAAREAGLSAEERLRLHQARSGPLMEDLHAWLTAQLADHRVEPNSGLGQAITYVVKRWTTFTLFLREPGAPLDNNICERALKKAILHRKNALFYKTARGAHVGDLFMSLIHTCELCRANPFEYLTALQRHATALARAPTAWLPWNYREALASATREPG
jgi:transposase